MTKADHIEILGVQIPLRTLAYVTSTAPDVIHATINSYEDRYSYSSPDIKKAIKNYEAKERKALKCLFNTNPPFVFEIPQ